MSQDVGGISDPWTGSATAATTITTLQPSSHINTGVKKLDQESPAPIIDSVDENSDDERTEYSSASTTPPPTKATYIRALMSDFLDDLVVSSLPDGADSSPEALTALFKAFALRFGYKAPPGPRRDIMRFVHKYSGYVTFSFSRYVIEY